MLDKTNRVQRVWDGRNPSTRAYVKRISKEFLMFSVWLFTTTASVVFIVWKFMFFLLNTSHVFFTYTNHDYLMYDDTLHSDEKQSSDSGRGGQNQKYRFLYVSRRRYFFSSFLIKTSWKNNRSRRIEQQIQSYKNRNETKLQNPTDWWRKLEIMWQDSNVLRTIDR